MNQEVTSIDAIYYNQKTLLETQEKQQRWNQSSENREDLIQRELAPLQKDIEAKKALFQSIQSQSATAHHDLEVYETLLTEKRAKKEEMRIRQEGLHSQLQQVHNSLESIISERKQLWRDNEALNTEIEKMTATCEKENSNLNRIV